MLDINIVGDSEYNLKRYIKEINKYKLLTREEEVVILEKIKNGDENAKMRLITANLRFVITIAKQYTDRGLELNELINEGNIGLITSIDKFDNTKNIKFITYAVWWIKQAINSAISEKSTGIRLPMNKINDVNKLFKIEHKLEQKLGRKPTEKEIINDEDAEGLKATKNKIDEWDIIDIMGSKKNEISLDKPLNNDKNDEKLTLSDIIGYDSEEIAQMDKIDDEINNVLNLLTEQERNVIILNYGVLNSNKRYDLEEIADMYSCSKERIRQIKERAIRKLREYPETNKLFIYF